MAFNESRSVKGKVIDGNHADTVSHYAKAGVSIVLAEMHQYYIELYISVKVDREWSN